MKFLLKKWLAFAIASITPFFCVLYSIMLYGNDLVALLLHGLLGFLFGAVIGVFLLESPWIAVLEGRGLACLELNSTGMANFYLTTTQLPFMVVKTQYEKIVTLFNRKLAMYLNRDVQPMRMDDTTENITFTMPKGKVSENTFKIYGMPFFIFNTKINSFVSKEILADQENKIMTEHLALEMRERIKTLNERLQDQQRGVMEMLKPSSIMEFLTQPMVLALTFSIGLLILVVMLMPEIMPMINNFMSGLGVSNTATSPVTGAPLSGQPVQHIEQAVI